MKTTTRTLALAACLFLSSTVRSQSVITVPREASPAALTQQTVGISTITVSYSRPSVKGREIWGKLVPYGMNVEGFGNGNPTPWRAGANENTVITLSDDAKFGGKDLKAGSYGLFYLIKDDNNAEIILSRDNRSWGNFWYEASHDVLHVDATVSEAPHHELLTYEFLNVGTNTATLVLEWEKKAFSVPITFDVDNIVMANAIEELKGPTGFSWQGYRSAALYAEQHNTHLELGMEWIDRAIAQSRSFATLSTKAALLRKMGSPAEADKIMEEAVGQATEGELNNYGYQLVNAKEFDRAIEIFTLNTKRHPKSANCWDSLGEGFALKGDEKNAVKNFKKALDMNPPANVKANSEKYLRQYGAL